MEGLGILFKGLVLPTLAKMAVLASLLLGVYALVNVTPRAFSAWRDFYDDKLGSALHEDGAASHAAGSAWPLALPTPVVAFEQIAPFV